MSITPPVEDLAPTSMNMLDDKLASNLRQMDYVDLLPLQEYATSVLLSERSLVVSAPTGSGKTAAYLIPTIEYVIRYRKSIGMAKGPLVLILSNTKSVLFHTFYTACTMAGCRQNPEVARCKVARHYCRQLRWRVDGSQQHEAKSNEAQNAVIDEVDMMIDEHLGLWYGLNKILEKIPGDTTIAGFQRPYCDESNLSFLSQLQVKLFRHAVPILINVAAPKGYITQRVLEKGRQLPEHPYWEPDFA
ncbi:DEAD (Asp-Glu-Ala-Asp) box polypeptide 59 [Parelaphostrongylus tenuis]|uniref:DEAD (Asp-Glu-Ala-Asp) box polypeptide 59 n=1 Tax=Parelaphostrongylus tenuis TaxID=148309 RepID=A0AAD5WGI8_PARTN|nr:DEAD (Asp-Glu-Ala-Asp) box polypeptide 59 [Parelaphostrongylus tenuis]